MTTGLGPPQVPASISVRRAYWDLAAFYALAFGGAAVSSVAYIIHTSGLLSAHANDLISAWYVPWHVWQIVAQWAVANVLVERDLRATPRTGWAVRLTPRLIMALRAAQVASAPAMVWMATHAWQIAAGQNSWRLARAAMTAILVALVLHRHGVRADSIGLRRRQSGDAARSRRVFAYSLFGILAANQAGIDIVRVALHVDPAMQAVRPSLVIPDPPLSVPGVLSMLGTALSAGVTEELLLSALLVTLLSRADRPRVEILVVAAAARVAFHLYNGVWGLGTCVFAMANVALYTRYRRIVPIIAAHTVYDTAVSLANDLPGTSRWVHGLLPPALGLAVLCADLAVSALRNRGRTLPESLDDIEQRAAREELAARAKSLSLFTRPEPDADAPAPPGTAQPQQPSAAAAIPALPAPRQDPDRDEY